MSVMSGYLIREITRGSVIALVILVTLFNLFSFSDEMKSLGKGHYGLYEIFWYLLLGTPRLIYELVPYSALLGSLLVLGGMANNREIVAMRAAGFSLFWLLRTIMLAGLLLVTFSIVIGEFLAPAAERTAQVLKTTAQNQQVVIHAKYGMWLRENNSFINVKQIYDDGKLGNINIFYYDDQYRLVKIEHAESANFIGSQQWRLDDIRWTDVSAQQVVSGESDAQIWKTSIDPDLLNLVVVKSDNLSLYDLYMYINFLQENNQKSQSYELAFWGRLINPLVTFVMLMVASPFVLTVKQRVGSSSRLVIGILIGLAFNNFDRIAGHVGLVYGMNPMLMALMPSVLTFCLAIYFVKRLR